MARRFRRGAQNAQRHRLTKWIGPADQGAVNVASTGATIISSVSFEDPATLVRTRGVVGVKLQAYGADSEVFGALGLGIVSAEALAIGVTAVPHPFRDPDWGGWFVWRTFFFRYEFHDATATMFPASIQFEIDSKAMRKVEPNEALVVVAESQVGSFAVADGTRVLVMLS